MGDSTCSDIEARWRMDVLKACYRRDIGYAAHSLGVSETWMRKSYRDTWKRKSADERKAKADKYGVTVEELDRVVNGKRTPAKEGE